MSIPIVIVWGSRDSFTPLGWTARNCPRCKKAQPFEAYKQTRAHHIYYLEYKTDEIGTIVACDFCDSTYALEKGEFTRVDARWSRPQGLEALVNATNPDLLPLPPKAPPSDQELFALLESTNEKGNVLGKDVSGLFMVGAVASGLVLGPLCAALRSFAILPKALDEIGWGAIGVILGGTLGGIVWAIVGGRRKGQAIIIDSLRRAMGKHWLDTATLRAALSRHPKRLGRVRRALATMA